MNGKEIIALLSGAALTGCQTAPTNLQEALDQLAKTNPTEQETIVTCYVMMPAGEKQQVYKCPVCGKKSVYKANTKGAEAVEELWEDEAKFSASALAKMKQFGISITLDDTEFCKACRKGSFRRENDNIYSDPVYDKSGIPQRQWVFRKTDAAGNPVPGSEWRVYRHSVDHVILEAFFEGKDTIGEMGGTIALKKYIRRLSELLKLQQPAS